MLRILCTTVKFSPREGNHAVVSALACLDSGTRQFKYCPQWQDYFSNQYSSQKCVPDNFQNFFDKHQRCKVIREVTSTSPRSHALDLYLRRPDTSPTEESVIRLPFFKKPLYVTCKFERRKRSSLAHVLMSLVDNPISSVSSGITYLSSM